MENMPSGEVIAMLRWILGGSFCVTGSLLAILTTIGFRFISQIDKLRDEFHELKGRCDTINGGK